MLNKMYDLRQYIGAPQRQKPRLLLSSMEGNMPANAPYPGESEAEFLIRMAAGGGAPSPYANTDPAAAAAMGAPMGAPPAPMGIDPRASAIARMMGNPETNPANTFNMGRTTENFYDEAPVAPTPAGRVQEAFSQFPERTDPYTSFPGTTPVEEMMMDPSFGGDASMADAYGGPDPYTAGLPGATGPRTPMQNRNRRVALSDPGETDDDFEQRQMVEDYEATDGSMDKVGPDGDDPSTEDELDMVQRNINKSGSDTGQSENGMTGNFENDLAVLESLADDDYDLDEYLDEFISRHGEDRVPERFRHRLDSDEE